MKRATSARPPAYLDGVDTRLAASGMAGLRTVAFRSSTCHWLMPPETIERPDFDPGDAADLWSFTNRQDWELSDGAPAGIASAGYRPGPSSNREELLTAFDRWVVGRAGPLDRS